VVGVNLGLNWLHFNFKGNTNEGEKMKDCTLNALSAARVELEAIENKTECQKDAIYLIDCALEEERG